MKLAFWSDMHYHPWTYGAVTLPSGVNSRLVDQADVTDQIRNHCAQAGVDHLFFLGDMFHRHGTVSAQVLQTAWARMCALKASGLQLYFLLGNHDMSDRSGRIHCLDWLREFGRVITTRETFEVDGVPIHAMGYTEDAEAIQEFFRRAPDASVCLLHQGVAGVPLGSGYVIDEILHPDLIPKRVRHVFTGHYHTHRQVTPQLTVVGSPLQLTWADAGESRGWVTYQPHVGMYGHVEHHESDAPKFLNLDAGGVSRIPGDTLRNHLSVFNNFVRVKNYYGDPEELRQQLLDVGARSVEFEIPPPESEARVETQTFSLEPVIQDLTSQIDDARRRAVGQELMNERYAIPVVRSE